MPALLNYGPPCSLRRSAATARRRRLEDHVVVSPASPITLANSMAGLDTNAGRPEAGSSMSDVVNGHDLTQDQLRPDPADGPPVVGATSVQLRGHQFHPAVIQINQGQAVTCSFDDNGTTHNVKSKGWASGDQDVSGTPSPRQAATGTPARCTSA